MNDIKINAPQTGNKTIFELTEASNTQLNSPNIFMPVSVYDDGQSKTYKVALETFIKRVTDGAAPDLTGYNIIQIPAKLLELNTGASHDSILSALNNDLLFISNVKSVFNTGKAIAYANNNSKSYPVYVDISSTNSLTIISYEKTGVTEYILSITNNVYSLSKKEYAYGGSSGGASAGIKFAPELYNATSAEKILTALGYASFEELLNDGDNLVKMPLYTGKQDKPTTLLKNAQLFPCFLSIIRASKELAHIYIGTFIRTMVNAPKIKTFAFTIVVNKSTNLFEVTKFEKKENDLLNDRMVVTRYIDLEGIFKLCTTVGYNLFLKQGEELYFDNLGQLDSKVVAQNPFTLFKDKVITFTGASGNIAYLEFRYGTGIYSLTSDVNREYKWQVNEIIIDNSNYATMIDFADNSPLPIFLDDTEPTEFYSKTITDFSFNGIRNTLGISDLEYVRNMGVVYNKVKKRIYALLEYENNSGDVIKVGISQWEKRGICPDSSKYGALSGNTIIPNDNTLYFAFNNDIYTGKELLEMV